MDVMCVCPLLIPQNLQRTVYDGFLSVQGQDLHMHIELPADGILRGASIECEWKLKHLLRGYETLLQQRLNQCSSLSSFLIELKSIVERKLTSHSNKQEVTPPSPCFYNHLLQDIEALGWDRIQFIDESFTELHLVARDESNRSHILRVKLHPKHPESAPTCSADLPQPFLFSWNDESSKLQNLIRQFKDQLKLHEDFWNIMDELDTKTWILEPEKPTRAATYRRIALGNNASLQVEVDAKHPGMLPECRFLGADRVVNPLKENLNTHIHSWDCRDGLLTNLQRVLSFEFPSPANTKKEDFSADCGICYSYRLDTHIPDQVCEDSRCGQPFHQACLYEWLRVLPSSRQSFNLVFGECPYCEQAITVKMPTGK